MKKISSLFLSFLLAASVFALEVDTDELKSLTENTEIEFINYEGPHAVINSIAQIKGIGSDIGIQVAKEIRN